jgi:hypothetical protein
VTVKVLGDQEDKFNNTATMAQIFGQKKDEIKEAAIKQEPYDCKMPTQASKMFANSLKGSDRPLEDAIPSSSKRQRCSGRLPGLSGQIGSHWAHLSSPPSTEPMSRYHPLPPTPIKQDHAGYTQGPFALPVGKVKTELLEESAKDGGPPHGRKRPLQNGEDVSGSSGVEDRYSMYDPRVLRAYQDKIRTLEDLREIYREQCERKTHRSGISSGEASKIERLWLMKDDVWAAKILEQRNKLRRLGAARDAEHEIRQQRRRMAAEKGVGPYSLEVFRPFDIKIASCLEHPFRKRARKGSRDRDNPAGYGRLTSSSSRETTTLPAAQQPDRRDEATLHVDRYESRGVRRVGYPAPLYP